MTQNQMAADEIEIDLLKLAELLLHKAKILIAATILIAAAAFGITYFLITPLYTSSALMYVNNSGFTVGSTSFSITSGELSAAQSLVDTYGVILKSRTTLEDVIRRDNLNYTYEELYGMVTTSSVNGTEIFRINVTSADPAEAERIANTIADMLPEKIASIVEGSDVRIVDYAVIPSSRTSPSFTKNTMIGALVGFVFAAAVIILRYLLDETIHTEDYLTQTYPNIPLLTVVPDMARGGKGKESGDYYAPSSKKTSQPSTKKQSKTASFDLTAKEEGKSNG